MTCMFTSNSFLCSLNMFQHMPRFFCQSEALLCGSFSSVDTDRHRFRKFIHDVNVIVLALWLTSKD